MNLSENLSEIVSRYNAARSAITITIINKGGAVSGGFEAFPDAINTIPSGGGEAGTVADNYVLKIGDMAYAYQSALKKVDLTGNTGLSYISTNAFVGCSMLSEVLFNKNKPIAFNTYVFQKCTALKKIAYQTSDALTASWMFSGCKALSQVFILDNESRFVHVFGNNTFSGCSSLNTVFLKHQGSASINLNTSRPFSGCTRLQSVYLLKSNLPSEITSSFFYGSPLSNGSSGHIIVYSECLESLRALSGWSMYSSILSAYNGVDYSEVFS